MKPKQKIFIGSSTEGKDIAQCLSTALIKKGFTVTPWYEAGFVPTGSTLDSILAFASEYDFAVLVLSTDDLTNIRGQESWSARDNVIFELGVFLAGLGKERTFFLIPRDHQRLRIPTDLAGITALTYERDPEDGNQPNVQNACEEINERINDVGAREKGMYVHIVNLNSTECLDVKDWNMLPGDVQAWPCHGCENQVWILQPTIDRKNPDKQFHRIKSLFSDKYLEIPKSNNEDGAPARQAYLTGEDNQKWRFIKMHDGTYQIINKESGKCLQRTADPEGDPHRVQQHTWNGGAHQKWWLTIRQLE